MATIFNNFFTSIGPTLAANIDDNASIELMPEPKSTKLTLQETTEAEILQTVQKMKPKTSCGVDGLSNKVIKRIILHILAPLTYIINYHIKRATFPDEWKIAKVIPIYKKIGDVENSSNYRPISLLPTFSKIFEKIIEKRIRSYMDDNEYWAPSQFGFRPGHETSHTITKALHLIQKAKQYKQSTIAVFLDLKKAFDTVDHDRLVRKTKLYGIDERLINSYLSNRHQYTEINSSSSNRKLITCGVPQGSILGPLLFLLYINDLQDHISGKALFFADDTTLLYSDYNDSNLIKRTNEGIFKANQWLTKNKLTVNRQKTKFMIFNNKNKEEFTNKIYWGLTPLNRVGNKEKENTIKYVGILLDENLTFKQHGYYIANKIRQNSYLISANKNILPFSTRKLLYTALIKPLISYGAEIYGPSNIKLISKCQKKVIRHVVRTKNYISHTNNFFILLETLKFKDIIHYNQIQLGYKMVHCLEPKGLKDIFPLVTSRHSYNIKTPVQSHLNNKELNMPHIAVTKTWNALPLPIKETISDKALKSQIKKKFFDEYINEETCSKKNCPSCQDSRPIFTS